MENTKSELWKKEDFIEPLITINFTKPHSGVKDFLLSDKENCYWEQLIKQPANSDIQVLKWDGDYKAKNDKILVRTAKYKHQPLVKRPLAPERVDIEEKQQLFVLDEKNFQIQISIQSFGVPFCDSFDCRWLHIVNDKTLTSYFRVNFKKFCLVKGIVQPDSETESKETAKVIYELLKHLYDQNENTKEEENETKQIKQNNKKFNKIIIGITCVAVVVISVWMYKSQGFYFSGGPSQSLNGGQ